MAVDSRTVPAPRSLLLAQCTQMKVHRVQLALCS